MGGKDGGRPYRFGVVKNKKGEDEPKKWTFDAGLYFFYFYVVFLVLKKKPRFYFISIIQDKLQTAFLSLNLIVQMKQPP